MKILYIIHSCVMGGATISLANLIKGVRAIGNEVAIVYPIEKDISVIKEFEELGCKCFCLKRIPCTWYFFDGIKNKIRLPLYILKLLIEKRIFYYQLKKIIMKENPDIIHTNVGVVHEGFAVARKLAIPHVWHLREYQVKDFRGHPFPFMWYFAKKLKRSYTVCITKDIQKYFDLHDCSKSFTIYDPVMSENYMPAKKKGMSNAPYFFVANRISREKGIEDIILAFYDFYKNNHFYKILICGFGDEPYINFLKEKCAKLHIENAVEFLGYASSKKVYELMCNSRALIVGSYNEGFGRMTAEANMLGVPVIGRNTAGTKEILDQTAGGLQFFTINDLVNKMNTISHMTEIEIADFMKGAKAKAKDLFSNEQHINKIISLYDAIVK